MPEPTKQEKALDESKTAVIDYLIELLEKMHDLLLIISKK